MKLFGLAIVGTAWFLVEAGTPAQERAPRTVQIGLMATTFPDQLGKTRQAVAVSFNRLIQNQTGVPSRCTVIEDVVALEQKLRSGEFQVGILNGFEFAWVQEKDPGLKPLAITVVHKRPWPVAYLVCRQDSPLRGFADLKEKKLSLPHGSRAHVRLFVQREKASAPDCTVEHPASIEQGLDDVVTGKVAAVVVDQSSLDAYHTIKPGCHRRLKVVQKSPVFPAGVIVYRPGSLSAEVLQRFEKGLLAAHHNVRQQFAMSLFRLSSFDPVPPNYFQVLSDIRKHYPALAPVP
jgi:ABC-type phosphate/phosphonate transport system substrate-binding protein